MYIVKDFNLRQNVLLVCDVYIYFNDFFLFLLLNVNTLNSSFNNCIHELSLVKIIIVSVICFHQEKSRLTL